MQAASHRRSMRFVRHAVIFAATLLGVAAAASAEERGWYLGMMLDNTAVDVTRGDCSYSYCDTETGPSEAGYALRGGLRLNRHLAVDFALRRNSGVQWTESFASVPGVPGMYESRVVFDANIAQAAVVGILPFGRVFEGFVRGGIESYQLSGKQSLTDQTGGPSLSRPVSDHGVRLLLGLGVGATVAKTWHVSLEYQTVTIDHTFVGVASGDDVWLDTIGFGIERRFGRGRSGRGDVGD